MVRPFLFARTPKIVFGVGSIVELPALARTFGNDILLVTGGSSFMNSKHGEYLLHTFELMGIRYHHVVVSREPSPEIIDQTVIRHRETTIRLVVAIGGGSVIDAGKAISAMIGQTASVRDFLEGVGSKEHPGTKIPFVAIPTTSGTGSEATKNAVISQIGTSGFKKSLRHDNFVPDVAILDPELTLNCPPDITAASGMDCFTQLVEAYVSDKATSLTDAMAFDAIGKLKSALPRAWRLGLDIESRSDMSYAALVSGICLANAGLGAVHGFASSIGGLFNVPHGTVCGTLMAPANDMNVKRLREQNNESPALTKYAALGQLFSDETQKSPEFYIDHFIHVLYEWTEMMNINRLGKYGIMNQDIDKIIPLTDLKNNPVKLSSEDLKEILFTRI
jgi:alcohol dehydrogenase class IV